jgi:hypothetical protein
LAAGFTAEAVGTEFNQPKAGKTFDAQNQRASTASAGWRAGMVVRPSRSSPLALLLSTDVSP